jgi:glycosyltransferase involved in cell wall biosynthesis
MRPHIRRLMPRQFHHFAGHIGRKLVRAIESRTPSAPIGPPAVLPVPPNALLDNGEMPIILVNASLTAGGAERQIVNLLRGFAVRGRRALLLTLHLDERPELRFFLDELEASGIEVRNAMPVAHAIDYLVHSCGAAAFDAFRKSLGWAPSDIRDDIIRLAAELHPVGRGIVHGWQDATGICAAFAGLATGVTRIVVAARNLHPEHFSYARPYMRQAYGFLTTRREVTLINNSAAGAHSYAEWLSLEPGRMGVVCNGIAADALVRPSADNIAAFRRSLGLPQGKLVVGGAFRFQAEKRPLLWLNVAARVSRRLPEVQFVIFGDGTMRGQMQKAAARFGLQERLKMPGSTNDLRPALAMLDVLLLTSSQEGTPNVVLEAACLGVPVVATDAGGIPEAMIDGRTGLLVHEDAVGEGRLADALADAVMQVLGGRISVEELRSLGPAFVNTRFGLDRMIEDTMAVYKKSAD